MSADAEYGCDIGFDAGYQCGKDESARRVAELEAYNTTRTDELAAAARRIAELEQQRDELLAALKDAYWQLTNARPVGVPFNFTLMEAAVAKVKP